MAFGAGVSAYIGGVYQGDSSVYVMKNKAFELESKRGENIGKFAKRHYFGFDAQFSVMSAAGLTQLRAEYIFGKHPGSKAAAYDFKFTALPQQPTYMRNISGGYVILAQDLGATPFSVVAKFDWYDPNTDISGNEISTSGEIMKSTIGLGAIWRINNALRLTAYYDMVQNETTDKLKNTVDDNGKITAYGYDSNRKDNVFTLRLQYKF